MKLVPPSSSVSSPDSSFRPGALVLFDQDGSAVLATIVTFKKQGYQLLTMRGREVELRPNRLFPLPGSIAPELKSSEERAKWLLGLYERGLKDAANFNLEELWTLVRDEGESFTTEKLASLYLGKYSLEQFLALRLALMADRIYFKRKDDEIAPRPLEIIEELKRNEDALKKKQIAQEATISAILKKVEDPTLPFPPESIPYLETLEELAAGVTDFDHGKLRDAKELLTIIGDKVRISLPPAKEKRAHALLKAIGHFRENTNLAAIRHRIPMRFSPEALKASEEIAEKAVDLKTADPAASKRVDLTHLRCYTVDDQTTKDMDDALSVEQTEDGYSLGIHISDVAALIPPDSYLDLEARRRTTSLYLAGETVNMLPEKLSHDIVSLVEGEPRLAMSYIFDVDRNFMVRGGKALPSVIKVTKRYTYAEVTEALEHGDHELTLLHSISATYESDRIAGGAMKVSKKEVLIYPREDGGYTLSEIDEDDPARTLVSELMVLANSFIADLAVKNKIPMVFRGQEQPEDESAPRAKLPPDGPAYDFYLRTRLKKSTTGITPVPHASLGLPAYAQCTSPIRRYMDLVNERQILSFIENGKPQYTGDELLKLIDEVDPHLASANQVSKETRRYYLLRYIQWMQRQKRNLSGTVVRLDGRTPLVELEVLYSTVFARLKPETKAGDRVELRILQADPEQDYLKLEQV